MDAYVVVVAVVVVVVVVFALAGGVGIICYCYPCYFDIPVATVAVGDVYLVELLSL